MNSWKKEDLKKKEMNRLKDNILYRLILKSTRMTFGFTHSLENQEKITING